MTQAIELRLEAVGGPDGDDFVIADGELAHRVVHRSRRAPVAALQIQLHFIRDVLVARARQDIQHRLGAHDLRGRRDQRRKAQVFAHARNLGQHLVHAMQRTLFLELLRQVGNHSARHLTGLDARVDAVELTFKLVILLAYHVKVHADFLQQRQIESGVVGRILERHHHALGRRVAGAPGHGADGRVHMPRAVFHRLVHADVGHAHGGVRMKMQRQLDGFR